MLYSPTMMFLPARRRQLLLSVLPCLGGMLALGAGCTGYVNDPGYGNPPAQNPMAPSAPQDPATPPVKPETPPSPTQPPTLTVQSTELVPLNITLSGGANPSPGSLPKGALFDARTGTVHWIPLRGQAGEHQITVTDDANREHRVEITVAAIPEETLRKGAPALYEDGEIGTIYLHGKTEGDLCLDRAALNDYWGNAINILSPTMATRTLACYDGSQRVADQADHVAQQILEAPCGRSGRCMIVAHSMGNLMIEYIFAQAKTNPTFDSVKDKVLFVLAVASAAGGSKAADLVINPRKYSAKQEIVGTVAKHFGADDGSTKNLVPSVSAQVAPMDSDAQTPFFMVGGYSKKIVEKEFKDWSNYLLSLFSDPDERIFNGDVSYATLDLAVHFKTRSDGVVGFRSACGVADSSTNAGPGRDAPLGDHITYCATAPKKPSHYPWLLASQNHTHIKLGGGDCGKLDCRLLIFDGKAFVESAAHAKMGAMATLRNLLTNRSRTFGLNRADITLNLQSGALN